MVSLLAIAAGANAQSPTAADSLDTKKTVFLRGSYQLGHVLKSNDFVKGNNPRGEPIDTYDALRIEFGWQTDGQHPWHKIYNYPAFGLGIMGADYFAEEELGQPTSLYGWFDWPLRRWGRLALVNTWGFGLTEDWKSYDPVSNPDNLAMGATSSVYIDAGFLLRYPLGRWGLSGGFSFTHFSNGGSKEPNWGINQAGGILRLDYRLSNREPVMMDVDVPPYVDKWEVFLYGAGARKQARFDTKNPEQIEAYLDERYFVGNFTLTFARQLTHKSKVGIGTDVWYDGSTAARMEIASGTQNVDLSTAESMNVGAHVMYEHVVNTVSVPIVVGYNFWRLEFGGQDARLYQKAGIKWHFYRDTFVGLNVRAVDFSRAVFLEWFLGYRWQWE